MRAAGSFEGWFYKRDGQTLGPLSARQLQGLLSEGRLSPRQAVWCQGSKRLLFVHAATAATGPEEKVAQPQIPA
jgi:hypothetical protein